MSPEKVEPLWQSVVGDTEPWRRGRLFLVLLAIFTFLIQCLTLGVLLLSGEIERLFVIGIFILIFWLQYYFIWIGVHWVRWLYGGWNALSGFASIIWGWRDQSTIIVIAGIYLFCVGAYLGLAPSAHFFAKRQRESVRWTEAMIVAAVFVLLLGSIGVGIIGLLGYKASLEKDARAFADTAFRSIFKEHDTYFMLDHASKGLNEIAGGREGLTRFMQGTYMQAGDIENIRQSEGSLDFRFSFPFHLASAGEMISDGTGSRGRVRMRIVVTDADGDWAIDGIRWSYF